ncbi:MAG: thiol reductant ABC exporter subunit CydD [Rhodobacterales bacterium]|nr:MAG: thiol reductant ABC exporter subunit CydD [Rhodobacterales bacterium]
MKRNMPSDTPSIRVRSDRLGAGLSLVASLIWPVQAALIAATLAGLLSSGGAVSPLLAMMGYFCLAVLRGWVEVLAQRRLSDQAEAELTRWRSRIVQAEARAARPSSAGDAGALAAMAAEKLEALRPYMLHYRPARLRTLVMPLVILALSLWYSWAVALVLLVAGPLIPVFMALVGWAAKEASARQMAEVGSLSDLLVDRIAALSELRLMGAGPAVVDGFHTASESLRQRTMAVLRIAFLSSTVLELFAALGVAMVAVWVGFSLLGVLDWGAWGAPLTPFAGIFLLLLAPDYFQPLRDLAASWHDKAGAEAVLDELTAWYHEDRPEIMGQGAAPALLAGSGPIRLRGVAVQRDGRLLRYPDFDIAPGARIAISGPSGVGKTTLLRLLAGLERPDEGEILIGDTPLSDAVAQDWRARLGWMPQAPHFLGRSLRHNITFGAALRPDTLDHAQLSRVVETLPQGLNTVLGERGAGLSGGEARRATLARALNAAPQCLLADEPTADLDAETAEAITRGLFDAAAQGAMLIVATHDSELISRMDHVIDLTREDNA